MTDVEVRAMVIAQCEREGSRERWCRKVNLSPSYVYRQLHGVDPIGAKLLRALGLKVEQVIYGEQL